MAIELWTGLGPRSLHLPTFSCVSRPPSLLSLALWTGGRLFLWSILSRASRNERLSKSKSRSVYIFRIASLTKWTQPCLGASLSNTTEAVELAPSPCLLPRGDDGRREGVRDVLRRTRGHGYDSPGADAGAREAATQASARA